MLDLRSAALKPIERGARLGWKELLRRWGGAVLVLAAAASLIWVIATRAVDPDGPGRILYALHDHLYLPLKGYLWDWAYPWSLALWIPLTLLGLAWAAFYLAGRSLASSAQAALLSWMLDRPGTRVLLMRCARTGLPSYLLRDAVAYKLEIATSSLRSAPTAALAALAAELTSLQDDADQHLEAAIQWAEALAVLEASRSNGGEDARPQDAEATVRRSRNPVARQGTPEGLLGEAFQWLSLPSDEDEKSQRHAFSWTSLARDLRDAGAPEEAFPAEESRLPSGTLKRIRLNRLGESAERRRRLLEEELRRLELERREDRLALMARRQRPLPLPVAQLPSAGRLAAALAFLYAIQSRQPEIALLWIDLLEGLHLALGLAPSQTHGDYALLVRDLPSALHYRLASTLAQRRQQSRESSWRAQAHRDDVLLSESDFLTARRRIASLRLAAGQD